MFDGSEILSYLISADDIASPVFRAVQENFGAMQKQVVTGSAEMVRSYESVGAAAGKAADGQKVLAAETNTAATAASRQIAAQRSAAGGLAALSSAHTGSASAARLSTAAHVGHDNVLTGLSTRLTSASSSARSWGNALSGLTVPIAAIGGASIYASSKFGALMEQLHTQAGVQQAVVNQWSAQVVKLAPELAQTPAALAAGLYHIASVGIPAAKSISVVTEAAKGANISGANLDDTANALATTLKNYPHIAGGATGAMAELNAIVGKGNLHMEDLVTNLGKVVPVAKVIGLTLHDTGTAIDVLTSHGIDASMATTQLRMAFALMENPTAKADAALKQIGLTHSQLASDMRKPNGLLVALTDLKTHLDAAYPPGRALTIQQEQQALDNYAASLKAAGVGAATYKTDVTKFYDQLKQGAGPKILQSQTLLSAFGGARSGAGILTLEQNLPQLAALQTSIPQGATAIDHLNKSVQAWDKTQQGQLEHLKAGIDTAAVEIGQTLAPEVLPVLHDVVTGVEDIARGFGGLPKSAKEGIAAILGISVVVGPLLKVMSPILRIAGAVTRIGGSGLSKLGGGAVGAATSTETPLGATGMIFGIRGAALPGSLTNPIAVTMVGGGVPGAIGAEGETAVAEGESVSPGGVILPRGVSAGATTLEEEAAVGGTSFLATVRAGLPGVVSGAMRGGMIALGGSLAAQFAGGMIGGSAGHTVSRIGTDAAYGAGIGSIIPGVGTLAGAGLGATVGALQSLFGGNTAGDAISKMIADLKALSAAPDPTKLKALHDSIVKLEGMTFLTTAPERTQLAALAAATTPVTGALNALANQKGTAAIEAALSQAMSTIQHDVPPGTQRVKDLGAAFGEAGALIQQGMQKGKINVRDGMVGLVSVITSEMATGVTGVKTGTESINKLLMLPSAQDNLSVAFRSMVKTITAQMADGALSVHEGVRKINQLLNQIQRSVTINVGVNVSTTNASPIAAFGGSPFSAIGGSGSVVAPKGASALMKRTVSFANEINAQHYNYEWGGGHNPSFAPTHGTGHGSGVGTGYDCSGTISAILHNDGLLDSPLTAAGFMNYGLPGEGGPNAITIYASPTHVFAKVGGRYFGTSSANPGGGAGWFTSADTSGFTVRHVDLSPTPGSFGVAVPGSTFFVNPSSPAAGAGSGHGSIFKGGGSSSPGLVNPAGTQPGSSTSTSTSYHYDWRTGTYHQFTAAQYKAMQAQWYKEHPHEPMPTSAAAAKHLHLLVGHEIESGASGIGLTGKDLFGNVAQINAALTSSLRAQGTSLAQAAATAPASMADQIDRSSISKIQALVKEAREFGLKGLTTGFLKDMESVTKSWGAAISSTFQTNLGSVSTAESLKVNKQQLGITGVTVKNGKIVFTGSQAVNPSASAATDPAYLLAQENAYGGYITSLQGERTQLQAEAAKAKKNHNTRLLDSINDDIASVDQAIASAKVDVTGLAAAYNQAVYQAMLASIQAAAAAFDQQSQNEGTAQAILATMGDVNGTSLSALQTLSQQQGGLTPAQIAQANADNAQFISGVNAQEAPLTGGMGRSGPGGLDQYINSFASMIAGSPGGLSPSTYGQFAQAFGGSNSELGVDFGALAAGPGTGPGQLAPSDYAAMLQTVISLMSTLAGLESSVTQNTQATSALTGATLQNTATVAGFGGQVTFTIGGDQSGQSYIAGETSSSTMTSHLGTGM